MAGTWKWYGQGALNVAKGNIDFDTDTFKILLTSSAYTPDQDTHAYRSDVTNEVTGTGYTAGGTTVTGVQVTYDSATNELRISWSSPQWASSTITARTAVLYKSRGGGAGADELVAYCTESTDVQTVNGTFTVTLPSPTLKVTLS